MVKIDIYDYEEDTTINDIDSEIESYNEEITYIIEMINLCEKLENNFFDKIDNLWNIKFKMISDDRKHNIHIDIDNMTYKNKFISLMKNTSYYTKLMKFRYKLDRQKNKLIDKLKQKNIK
jgi:hypothetical protein